jgi:voltage-gated potassium channel
MSHWATELIVALLIVVSVVLVLMEAALEPDHPWFEAVLWGNHAITAIFVVELSLRFYGERRKKNFFKRYWYDLLAVLPLFRAVRFLRVLRLLRIFRFGVIAIRRLSRFSRMIRYIRVEYVIVSLVALTIVLMGGLSIHYAVPEFSPIAGEHSLERSMWFALLSLIAGEPVGGIPSTRLGLVVTATIMLGGLTVFAILTGTVSAVMIDVFRSLKLKPMAIDDLDDHVVVCGWNQAGPLLLEELLEDEDRFSHVVVVTERDDLEQHPMIQSHPSEIFTIEGDYTRMDVLQRAGVPRASYALLLADTSIEERSSQDRDARTVLAAMLIEKLQSDIYTTVQLLNRDNESSLKQIGVEEIIVSDEYVGNIMANVTKNRGIVRMLDELLTAKWGHQFYKEPVPERLIGMEIGKAISVLKSHYDATLLGVDRCTDDPEHDVVVNPPTDLVLEEGHLLFVAAPESLEDRDAAS